MCVGRLGGERGMVDTLSFSVLPNPTEVSPSSSISLALSSASRFISFTSAICVYAYIRNIVNLLII